VLAVGIVAAIRLRWFLVGLALGACSRAPVSPVRANPPAIAKLTPAGLEGAWLGMTWDELTAARPGVRPHTNPEFRFRKELFEYPGGGLDAVTYYLSKADPPRLYQIIVVYADPALPEKLIESTYAPLGKADETNDEILIDGYSIPVRAWAYDKRLILVAPMIESED